ncbi:MAG: RNA polymerase sigma factor [Desulfobacterales bacterium]|uniref:RNA polymerase sigma factor n=1 Tax=Candidatus Desulfaltia bathyphila TaxID=2841697 RepID=A0A8J6N6R6_9BACT|nr:RNA polymerase sigma factor [Candidatus Desulfaltia bathyphila]MBL7195577.1 RNA polymerase sigma factor [Desulfobacterales bacterium]MBL7207056.1 RNA polymerase sigma factor [Desulfobacterales bacterium]
MNDYENIPDEQLVQLSLKDQDCFYYLMKRYEIKLLRYIKRLTTVSQEEAEDIIQEIFIKVYRNLNGFNRKLKFSSWIYRIARNEIINQYRKTKLRLAMTPLNIEDEENLIDSINDTIEINEAYENLENAERVRKALSELPDKYREILILRYLEDKTYDEISDILRKPPGTVATQINRAKASFKKIAGRHQLDKGIVK